MKTFDLDKHLRTEHAQTPLAHYLREIVYGGNDGIVTTFAVVAGFAGAQRDPTTSAIPMISVLLFGLANLFADALSMSLGSFLSLRADQDVYGAEKKKEYHEIIHSPQTEELETIEILKRKKFTERDAKTIAALYKKNPDYWTQFMMRDELEMDNPEKEHPLAIAISTFLSFIAFGSIPLIPYLLRLEAKNIFSISVFFTTLALVLLGVFRSLVSKQAAFRGIIETLLVGGLSAYVAYFVGSFFRI